MTGQRDSVTVRALAADGTELNAELVRGASSDTVVLLHGFGENRAAWIDTCDALSGLCSVANIDLRGHGDSGPSRSGRYDLELYMTDVLILLGRLSLKRVILVGHSLGAWIAAHVTAHHPALVRALALIDIGPETDARVQSSIFDGLQQRLRVYASVGEYSDWLLANRQLLTPAAAAKLALAALRAADGGYELKIDPVLAAQRDLGIRSGSAELAKLLQRITCPSLIVRGVASAFLTASAAKGIAAQLRQADVITVPRAGHGVMADNPAAFNRALRTFVVSVLGSSASADARADSAPSC